MSGDHVSALMVELWCLSCVTAPACHVKVKALVTQSCPTLCDPMGCSPPGTSVCGVSQARILEWVALSFSRVSSRPRDRTLVSCIAGSFLTIWATWLNKCPPPGDLLKSQIEIAVWFLSSWLRRWDQDMHFHQFQGDAAAAGLETALREAVLQKMEKESKNPGSVPGSSLELWTIK